MLDMLYGMTGIVFAWVVMGLFWLPMLILIEHLVLQYVKYATVDKFKPKNRIEQLFDKTR